MKTFLIAICVLFSLSICARQKQVQSFVLKGKLQNGANTKLALQNNGATTFMDSTTANACGNFIFKGTVKELGVFLFGVKGSSNYLQFQVEKGIITVKGDAKDIRHAT